jgi:hypothetical protein
MRFSHCGYRLKRSNMTVRGYPIVEGKGVLIVDLHEHCRAVGCNECGAAGGDTIGNDRLICSDIARGHMLDGDLPLAAATVATSLSTCFSNDRSATRRLRRTFAHGQ